MPEVDIGEIFVNNLKKLLQANNMTYKELALKIGVKASSVSMWINGKSLPRMGKLDKIADLFGISAESLITSENLEPRHTLAAHFDGDEYTDEELKEIRRFAEYIKSLRQIERNNPDKSGNN